MRLGTRIFICYMIIFAICLYSPLNRILETLRTRYLEGVEDPLVDQANILAAMAGTQMAAGVFDAKRWREAFDLLHARPLSAPIYKLVKDRVDARVYITDARGRIIFDSEDQARPGDDYSQWRDVHLTLKGQYGARATPRDPNDPDSTVLYVAAPIHAGGTLAGVLTVAKPTTNIKYFLKSARPQILGIGLLYLMAAASLSFLVSLLLTRPIKRLTRYARQIRDGRRPAFPKLDRSEIGEMGAAFEEMVAALEGKRYVEQYVQNLTHEIKSPLSAIRGAAELMEEPMAEERRARFMANIRAEALRIQRIIDRMLALSALENQKRLQRVEKVAIRPMIHTVVESQAPVLTQKGIAPSVDADAGLCVSGDAFLLHQAVSNLLRNAIDFSPPGGAIAITARRAGAGGMGLTITDEGPGIPDYARERIFEKFFSLQRPDTGAKSTGLGLNFVREVAALHGGTIRLENRAEKGAAAIFEIGA